MQCRSPKNMRFQMPCLRWSLSFMDELRLDITIKDQSTNPPSSTLYN